MYDKEKRRLKYMSKMRHKKRLERMLKSWRCYPAVAICMDEKCSRNEKYKTIQKPYAKKIYLSSHCDRYRYYKKHSNRKLNMIIKGD